MYMYIPCIHIYNTLSLSLSLTLSVCVYVYRHAWEAERSALRVEGDKFKYKIASLQQELQQIQQSNKALNHKLEACTYIYCVCVRVCVCACLHIYIYI
jgi:hypothetical protein